MQQKEYFGCLEETCPYLRKPTPRKILYLNPLTHTYTAVPMTIGHTTTRYALTTRCALDDIVSTKFDSMLSDIFRYQTLWTDSNWSDTVKEKYILESVLPDDFVLSTYYAASREMLALASNKKSQAKLKRVPTVPTGCPGEDYRVKRVLEPAVDIRGDATVIPQYWSASYHSVLLQRQIQRIARRLRRVSSLSLLCEAIC